MRTQLTPVTQGRAHELVVPAVLTSRLSCGLPRSCRVVAVWYILGGIMAMVALFAVPAPGRFHNPLQTLSLTPKTEHAVRGASRRHCRDLLLSCWPVDGMSVRPKAMLQLQACFSGLMQTQTVGTTPAAHLCTLLSATSSCPWCG